MPSAKIDAAFWDTSAVALLCVHQAPSGRARRLASQARRMVLWWSTTVEARSSFRRLLREGALTQDELVAALHRLSVIHQQADEVLPTARVRNLAEDVLDRTPLRSADALQLGAALAACKERPRGRWFVCFDVRLARAAETVGFTVLPSPG